MYVMLCPSFEGKSTWRGLVLFLSYLILRPSWTLSISNCLATFLYTLTHMQFKFEKMNGHSYAGTIFVAFSIKC